MFPLMGGLGGKSTYTCRLQLLGPGPTGPWVHGDQINPHIDKPALPLRLFLFIPVGSLNRHRQFGSSFETAKPPNHQKTAKE